jgi:hypothetical protein
MFSAFNSLHRHRDGCAAKHKAGFAERQHAGADLKAVVLGQPSLARRFCAKVAQAPLHVCAIHARFRCSKMLKHAQIS